MTDPSNAQQIAEYVQHLADDLKPWAPVGVPILLFGKKQAIAIVKRFQTYFQDDASETCAQALQNGADAAQRINAAVNERIESGELTEEQAKAAFERPDIAKPVQDALLAASETPDTDLHEELAKLIAARLVAPRDSKLSILLRRASEKLRYLNARQLRLLGLAFAVLRVEPSIPNFDVTDEAALDAVWAQYNQDLADTIAPFQSLDPPQSLEFIHFEELGLMKLSRWSAIMGRYTSEDVTRSPSLDALQRFGSRPLAPTPRSAAVKRIELLMSGSVPKDHFPLQVVRLTPVGTLIGAFQYHIAQGLPLTLGADWSTERK